MQYRSKGGALFALKQEYDALSSVHARRAKVFKDKEQQNFNI